MRTAGLLLVSAGVLFGQSRRPLIAVAGIAHESASFNPAKTTLADFGWDGDRSPAAVISQHALANTTVSGYLEAAEQTGLQLYHTVVVSATPKGPVVKQAFETMADEMIRMLKAAPKLDGILMPLHGAMVVDGYASGDAELVRRVRAAMGREIPLVVNHDFHANVTPEIVRDSNVLITYQETPHIDPKERGARAARIMAKMLAGQVKPAQAIAKPHMVYNIVFQQTKREPLLPIVEESRRLEQNPKVLAVSVSGGYQYADVPSMGPSVIVVTDNDPGLAQREAQRLSDMLWATRDRLKLNVPDAREAVRRAMSATRFPVALMDMGDNIGGGSAGDSTFILAELLRQKAQGWVVVIADPEAATAAMRAGIGHPFSGLVGGKTDHMHGDPVPIKGRVRSMHEGRYIEPEVRHGGSRYWDMGHTAVIEVEGSTPDSLNLLLLTVKRSSPDSLHQLISCGVYPERQRILVAKGTIAPRAAYEPVAAEIIPVDTPGITAVNPARFTYKHAPPDLFGLK